MYSIGIHNRSKIHYYILVEESFSEENKKPLRDVALMFGFYIDFFCISADVTEVLPAQRAYQSKRITRATYFRLFASSILPKDVSKVLYLDGDTLVRHSLSGLWNVNIDKYPLAAVKDMDSLNENKRLNLSPSAIYINAGVMLINLDYWRKNDCISKCLAIISEKENELLAHDQDIVNILFENKIKLLPLSYNLQNGFLYNKNIYRRTDEEIAEIIKYKDDPIILHFSTNDKPWNLECFHPYRKEWRDILMRSPWAKKRLKGDNRESFKQIVRSFLIRHYLYVAKNLYGTTH